jgi:hypothetical protein
MCEGGKGENKLKIRLMVKVYATIYTKEVEVVSYFYKEKLNKNRLKKKGNTTMFSLTILSLLTYYTPCH